MFFFFIYPRPVGLFATFCASSVITMCMHRKWLLRTSNLAKNDLPSKWAFNSHVMNIIFSLAIQSVPELPPHRQQACADSKRDSKMTKTNFPCSSQNLVMKFSISPIPEARPQVLVKNLGSKNHYWCRNNQRKELGILISKFRQRKIAIILPSWCSPLIGQV
jgi:hypothetical protein